MAEKKTRTYTNADTKRTPMTVTVKDSQGRTEKDRLQRIYEEMLAEPSADDILAGAKASLRRSEPLAQSLRNDRNREGRAAGDAAGAREQARLSNSVGQFVRGVREIPAVRKVREHPYTQAALIGGSLIPSPAQPAIAALLAAEGVGDFAEDPSLASGSLAALGVLPGVGGAVLRRIRGTRAAAEGATTAKTGVYDQWMPNTSKSKYQTRPSEGGYVAGNTRASQPKPGPYTRPDDIEYVRGDRWMPNQPASSTATADDAAAMPFRSPVDHWMPNRPASSTAAADDAAALPFRSPVDRWMPNTPASPTLADTSSRLSLRRLLDEDARGVAADIEAAASRGPAVPVTNVRVGADELTGPSRFDLSRSQQQGVEALDALLERTGGRTAARIAGGVSQDVPVTRVPMWATGDEFAGAHELARGGHFKGPLRRAQRKAKRNSPYVNEKWDEIAAPLNTAEREFYYNDIFGR